MIPPENDPSDPPRQPPVLIEIGAGPAPDPASAPPVDPPPAVAPVAAAGRRGGLTLWALGAVGGFLAYGAAISAWDFVLGLMARNVLLGGIALGLAGAAGLGVLALILREILALARLRQIGTLRAGAEAARRSADPAAARACVAGLMRLHAGRADLSGALDELRRRAPETVDAAALLDLAEHRLLGPLDQAAEAEIAAAARQVAAVTALVPLALADLATTLVVNLRMIRRIAEIHGGRAGLVGGWRVLRLVLAHLVATGALAAGDDLVQSVAGGGMLARVSRRFGEGVVNGALTARVGLAALEVCRPMPFVARTRPGSSAILGRGLAGLFARGPEGS